MALKISNNVDFLLFIRVPDLRKKKGRGIQIPKSANIKEAGYEGDGEKYKSPVKIKKKHKRKQKQQIYANKFERLLSNKYFNGYTDSQDNYTKFTESVCESVWEASYFFFSGDSDIECLFKGSFSGGAVNLTPPPSIF